MANNSQLARIVPRVEPWSNFADYGSEGEPIDVSSDLYVPGLDLRSKNPFVDTVTRILKTRGQNFVQTTDDARTRARKSLIVLFWVMRSQFRGLRLNSRNFWKNVRRVFIFDRDDCPAGLDDLLGIAEMYLAGRINYLVRTPPADRVGTIVGRAIDLWMDHHDRLNAVGVSTVSFTPYKTLTPELRQTLAANEFQGKLFEGLRRERQLEDASMMMSGEV